MAFIRVYYNEIEQMVAQSSSSTQYKDLYNSFLDILCDDAKRNGKLTINKIDISFYQDGVENDKVLKEFCNEELYNLKELFKTEKRALYGFNEGDCVTVKSKRRLIQQGVITKCTHDTYDEKTYTIKIDGKDEEMENVDSRFIVLIPITNNVQTPSTAARRMRWGYYYIYESSEPHKKTCFTNDYHQQQLNIYNFLYFLFLCYVCNF